MKRIVVVSSVPAFPASSGNRARVCQLVRALVELGHKVDFVYIQTKYEEVDHAGHVKEFGAGGYEIVDGLRGFGNAVHRFRVKARRAVSISCSVLGADRWVPLPVDHLLKDEWMPAIAEFLMGADVVIAEYVFMSKILTCAPEGSLKVIDTHDVFSDRHVQFREHGSPAGFWVSFRKQEEALSLCRADVVIAIQEIERARLEAAISALPLSKKTAPEVVTVSHLLKIGEPLRPAETLAGATFIGSNSPANRSSLRWFIDCVLPHVRRAIPDFVLNVVGAVGSSVEGCRGVWVQGRVASLECAYAEYPLAINPITVGTGINIKLLEAMALGVPVVSTKIGVRGVGSGFLSGVLVVPDENPEAFAKGVVDVASSASFRAQLSSSTYSDAQRWNRAQMDGLRQLLDLGRRSNLAMIHER